MASMTSIAKKLMQDTPGESAYDMIIVGLGPVGAVAANYAGLWGLKTLVIEKTNSPHSEPRAFSCDEEGMRIYQQLGLHEEIIKSSFADTEILYRGVDSKIFATIQVGKVDLGFGFRSLYLFHQPVLEKILRGGLHRFPHVQVIENSEVIALEDDGDLTAVVVQQDNDQRRFRARYIAACDGSGSSMRKLCKIRMTGVQDPEPWLAVSGVVEDKHVKIKRTSFICDPHRPTFVGRGPFNQYRFEFKVRPDESSDTLERRDAIDALIKPYVEPEHFQLQRAAVYRFQYRLAEQWRRGNIFMLGDAAHTMPPFMGQGLVSGLRDAANLIWKIVLVNRGAAPHILDSYQLEREAHTKAMADLSVKMGLVFNNSNRSTAIIRDFLFKSIQIFPAVRNFISMMKFKAIPRHYAGFLLDVKSAGSFFPQSTVLCPDGSEKMLDDKLGKGFAIVHVGKAPTFGRASLWSQLDVHVVGLDNLRIADDRVLRWFTRFGHTIAVVRPDRFVLGSCTHDDFFELEKKIGRALSFH